jgi:DNA-binding LacI/PurR family transcriptional regulator/signal transduction histidine kinase
MTTSKKQVRPTLGVLIGWEAYAWILHGFVRLVFRGIQAAARARDCNVLLSCGVYGGISYQMRPAWPVVSPDTRFVPVGPWNTDGLIVVTPLLSPERSDYIQQVVASGHPVVFIGPGEGRPAVIPDNASGVHEAVAHLVEHGHRRILFVGDRGKEGEDMWERFEAYQAAIHEFGLADDPDLVTDGGSEMSAIASMKRVLQSDLSFTAVLATNDDAAFGVLMALREAGRRVPEEIAVVGFDDRMEAAGSSPPLTTVHYPMYEVGYRAVEMTLDRLAGKMTEPQIVKLPTQLVVRRSCGCLADAVPFIARLPELNIQSARGRLIEKVSLSVLSRSRALSSDEVHDMAGRLVEAFLAGLHGEPVTFLVTLMEILGQLEQADESAHAWQAALSALEDEGPALAEERGRLALSETAHAMLREARVAISENAERRYTRLMSRQFVLSYEEGVLSTNLLAAVDTSQIPQVLASRLPALGIHHAHVFFFEPEEDDPVAQSRLLPGPGQRPERFSSREFPPLGLYPASEAFQLALLPLAIEDELAGYVALEAGNLEPGAAIVGQLAAAVKSARLHADQARRALELQEAYQALQANQARLLAAEKMASLGRLTAGIAHEMNTPLSAVRAALAQLEESAREYQRSVGDATVTGDDHQEIAQEMLETIQLATKAAERAVSFVRSIKTQTRDFGPRDQQLFDAVPVIRDALLLLGHALRRAKCVTNLEMSQASVEFLGSPGRLAQVVTNLVTNALEASMEKGGGPISVWLGTSLAGVELRISDQGMGIAPEVLPKIFDPLFTTKPFGEGTGLGLTIVHDIVTGEFGGRIEVKTRLGEGTTFTVIFPEPIREA